MQLLRTVVDLVNEVLTMLVYAYPQSIEKARRIKFYPSRDPLRVSERDEPLGAYYNAALHGVVISVETAKTVNRVVSEIDYGGEEHLAVYQLFAHTIMIGLADESLVHDELREALASYLVQNAVRKERPGFVAGVTRAYGEWGLRRSVAIGERIGSLTSNRRFEHIEAAFFEGKPQGLKDALAEKVQNSAVIFHLLAQKPDGFEDNRIEILHILGVTLPQTPEEQTLRNLMPGFVRPII